MRILQLVTMRQHRGAELSAWNLSRVLLQNGHEVFWVGLFPAGENVLTLEGAENMDLPGSKKSFIDFNKVKALKQLIKEKKIDIIQANGAENLKYSVAATRYRNAPPIVYRNISLVSFWMKKSLPKRLLNGFLFSKTAHVVSVGKSAMEDLLSVFPKLQSRISVISRGVPLVAVDKQSARKKVSEDFGTGDNALLLWVGALSSEKNPLFIIDVMEEVLKQHPACTLIMAGKGTMREEIEQKINERNLSGKIILAGYRNDLPELNAAADVLVLSSFIEGVPGVILEAGLQETPSVSVNVGGVKEAVIHNETGVMIEQHDVQQFSKAVVELLNDKSKAHLMGQKAKAFVLENYNEIKNTAMFEKLYAGLIKK